MAQISRAIDTCIKQNILADILIKCKNEVFHMLLTEYDEKLHLKNTREEGREEGKEIGKEIGHSQINALNAKLLEQNRLDDLKKATYDKEYQKKLLEEFKL